MKYSVLFYFCSFSLLKCFAENLISVVVVHSHGDITPYFTYPNDPNEDKVYKDYGSGQLTRTGQQRLYALGKFLRQRYANFLPQKYSNNDIYVVSADTARCLMSAASNLAGLYPPRVYEALDEKIQWQPIPIHTNSTLLSGSAKNCDEFEEEMIRATATPYIKIVNAENKKLYQIARKNSGITDIFGIKSLAEFHEILYAESCMNLTLPDWTKEIYPENMTTLAAIYMSLDVCTTKLARFNAGPLFYQIIQDFNVRGYKFYVYSAQQRNIVQLALTLAPNMAKFYPEFGSMVVFELWENQGVKYVKAFLKNTGDVEEINIEGCDGGCSFDKFREVLKGTVITEEEFNAECEIKI